MFIEIKNYEIIGLISCSINSIARKNLLPYLEDAHGVKTDSSRLSKYKSPIPSVAGHMLIQKLNDRIKCACHKGVGVYVFNLGFCNSHL